MAPWAWVVILFVYFLIGCVLLLRLSERDRGLAPDPGWMGVVWILMWPLILGVWAAFRLPGPPTAPETPGRVQPGRLPPAGVAVSALSPGGTVEVAGRRYAATAEGGPVRAGEPVEIIGRAGRVLRVRSCSADPGAAAGRADPG